MDYRLLRSANVRLQLTGHYSLITICTLLVTFSLLVGCKSSSKVNTRNNITEEQLQLDADFISGKIQQINGNTEASLDELRKIISRAPQYAPAYYEMSRIFLDKGMSDSALYCAQKAESLDDENLWYKMQLAEIYDYRKEAKPLVDIWEKLTKRYPDKVDYYYELSNAYISLNDIPAAVEALNRVEKRFGVTEEVSLQKQKLWVAIGQEDKAIKEIETLANAMPQEQKYNAILAELHMKKGEYAAAKTYYDNILKHHPNDEYIHISLASYYKQTGDMEKANQEIQQGLIQSALDCRSKLQILLSFYSEEEFHNKYKKTTYPLIDSIMVHCDSYPAATLFYGDILMRQEKFKEAAAQYRSYLNNDSSEYEVWEALLVCENSLFDSAAEEQTLRDAQRASQLFPLHILPYYLQGFIVFQRNHFEEAIDLLNQCEKIGFNKGYLQNETYALLAECHYRAGNHEECWKYFDKYLKQEPSDWGMMNNYAYYLAQQETRLEYAESLSKQTLQNEPESDTFLDTYAWILHKLGRDCEALPYIKRALKKQRDNDNTLQSHYDEISQGCNE